MFDVVCEGAFLIPYLLAMFAAGYPLMLMEYVLGQYGRQGVVGVWRACPLFQGKSASSVLSCAIWGTINGFEKYQNAMER